MSTCPLNTYQTGSIGDVSGLRCEACTPGCAVCNSTNCITCKRDFFKQGDACVPANLCIDGTGAVQGGDPALGGECVQCADPLACTTCAGPGAFECVACQAGLLLQNGTCALSCDTGHALGLAPPPASLANPDPASDGDVVQCLPCERFVPGCQTCGITGTTTTIATTAPAAASTATANVNGNNNNNSTTMTTTTTTSTSNDGDDDDDDDTDDGPALPAGSDVTCTRCQDEFYLDAGAGECVAVTRCNAFEKAIVQATPTSDTRCLSCVLCESDLTYDASGCQTVRSNTDCAVCSFTCSTPGHLPVGPCTPTSTPQCMFPTAAAADVQYPPQLLAFVETTFTVTGLGNASLLAGSAAADFTAALYAASDVFSLTATTTLATMTMTTGTGAADTTTATLTTDATGGGGAGGADTKAGVAARNAAGVRGVRGVAGGVGAVGAGGSTTTVQAQSLVSAFAPRVVSPVALTVRVRASVPASTAAAAKAELQSYQLSGPFDKLLQALPSAYAGMFLSASTPAVIESDVVLRNVVVRNETSRALLVTWQDVVSAPPAHLPVTYVVHLARDATATRLSFETRDTAFEFDVEALGLAAGTYTVAVGVVLDSGAGGSVGVSMAGTAAAAAATATVAGPLTRVTAAVPACEEGCAECNMQACLACNDTVNMVPRGDTCVSASSSSGSLCLSLGGADLCDALLILAGIGVLVVLLAMLTAMYCCCTCGRVRHKRDAREWKEYELEDVKFLPRWTTSDQQTQCVFFLSSFLCWGWGGLGTEEWDEGSVCMCVHVCACVCM